MMTLGFTTQYYTLWEVGEPYKKYTAGATVNGVFTGSHYMAQDYRYLQNLSKDYDAAVAKIIEMSADQYTINLDLRGHSSFTREVAGTRGNDIPEYAFTFGQLIGQDIREAVDIWQLTRAAKEETGKRRRAIARRRLINLGALVRNPTGDGERWITAKQRAYLQDKAKKQRASGHHFENGKRMTMAIRRVGGTSYETKFGTVYIQEYMTEAGQLVKYKGGSPLDIDDEQFTIVIGSVEHGEYQGELETRLKRMKKVI